MSTSSSIGRNDTTGVRRPSRDEQHQDNTTSVNGGSSNDSDIALRVPADIPESGASSQSNSYVGSLLSGDVNFLTGDNFTPISQAEYESYIRSQDWFASLPDYYKQQVLNNPYLASLNAVKDGIFEKITHKALEKRRQAVTQLNEYIASILEKQGQRENTLPETQVKDYYTGGVNPQFQNIGPSSVDGQAKTDGSASIDTSPVIEPNDVLSCISSAIGAVSDIWTGAMSGYKSLMEAKNFRVDNDIKTATARSTRFSLFKDIYKSLSGEGRFDDPDYFKKSIEPIFGKKFSSEFMDFFGAYLGSSESTIVDTSLDLGVKRASNEFWSEENREYDILRRNNIEKRRVSSSDEGGQEYFEHLAKLYDLYDKYNSEASAYQARYESDYYDVLDGSTQGRSENASYDKNANTSEAIAALRGELNDYIQTVKRKAREGNGFYEVLLASASFASLFIEIQGLPHYGSRSSTRRSVDSNGEFVETKDRSSSFGF